MAKLNHHYQKLSPNYLFPEIERRVFAFREKEPHAPLVHLGIGDIAHPLLPSVTAALLESSKEMGQIPYGYGPSEGYSFLRNAIAEHDYKDLGISLDEIFISNGAKCDIGNLHELFDADNRVALPDPTYPVYLDTTIMAGRTRPLLKSGRYGGITYLPCTEQNQFQPLPPFTHVDLIYLCSPNNPTGVAMEKPLLQRWVDYAKEHNAIIFFDGAYEAYIQSENCPRSIYEIPGAKEVAIEIRSFSKTAGFTGLRCSYTVIPRSLKMSDAGKIHSLHTLWKRRHDTKFNGVPYPVQRAAATLYTLEGKQEVTKAIAEYHLRSRQILEGLKNLGCTVYGGIDAPYLWWKVPSSFTSWSFFDHLLTKAHLISVPGKGFGLKGEGFIRLSAFADSAAIQASLSRIQEVL